MTQSFTPVHRSMTNGMQHWLAVCVDCRNVCTSLFKKTQSILYNNRNSSHNAVNCNYRYCYNIRDSQKALLKAVSRSHMSNRKRIYNFMFVCLSVCLMLLTANTARPSATILYRYRLISKDLTVVRGRRFEITIITYANI